MDQSAGTPLRLFAFGLVSRIFHQAAIGHVVVTLWRFLPVFGVTFFHYHFSLLAQYAADSLPLAMFLA